MSFFAELEKLLGIATQALPVIAAVNTASNPAASNNSVNTTAALIAMVQPIVAQGEAISAAAATPLTGQQKFDYAMQAVSVAMQLGTAAGVITQPEAAIVPVLTGAINAAVALKNSQNPPAA